MGLITSIIKANDNTCHFLLKKEVLEMSNQELGENEFDPLYIQAERSVVQEGDWFLLHFADGKQVFGQCLINSKGKTPPIKINKRTYPTYNLRGLAYGIVLELTHNRLIPVEDGEDLISEVVRGAEEEQQPSMEQANDNRSLVDNNQSQALTSEDLKKLLDDGTDGSKIIQSLIQNSATFELKTEFSKQKYIQRKQWKYQPRCRLVRCTGRTICEALHLKDPRKVMNFRDDTLGQILSYANIAAGKQVLVFDPGVMGLLVGSLAHRMGGYGKILSLYSGQQPAFMDMLDKFNLSFGEQYSIKWLHCEDVFATADTTTTADFDEVDVEAKDRDSLIWPCPLQPNDVCDLPER
jgi:tRNA (adenine58-N1)-methyltransferase non-catalytic subunit